jgi:iron complex transport system permease protein
VALRQAQQLNALMLGEEEARHLGVRVGRLKLVILILNVALVAVATAFTGVIAFVGLIVPHLLRMMRGSDNRYLIRGAVLAGGAMLGLADLAARLLVAPAELPIGIVTSMVGVPVFVVLLRRNRFYF